MAAELIGPARGRSGSLTGAAGSVRRWASLAREGVGRRDGLPSATSIPAVVVVILYVGLLLCIPSQLIFGPLGSPGTPANILGVAALFWWVCARLGGLSIRRRLSPVRVALGLVLVSVVLSYASGMLHGWWAPANVHQVTDNVYDLVPPRPAELQERMMTAASRGLIAIAGWSGILLLTADGLRSRRDVSLVVTWIVRFGVFVGSLGILQFFTGLDIAQYFVIPGLTANAEFGAVDSRSVLNRVSATAVHPIEFGVVMAMVFLLSLHRSLYRRPSLANWLPTVILGLAMPMSVSRSAILATAVGALIMFIGWAPTRRLRAVLIFPFAVVGIRLIAPGLVGTIRSLFSNVGNDPSISGRTDDYAMALRIIDIHPILGRGLFTFIPRYYRILDNQVLMIIIELGLVGLVTVVGLFVTAFLAARGAYRRSADPESAHLGLTLSGALIGLLLSYATFDAWGFPMVAGVSFLLMGLASACWQVACAEQQERLGYVPLVHDVVGPPSWRAR